MLRSKQPSTTGIRMRQALSNRRTMTRLFPWIVAVVCGVCILLGVRLASCEEALEEVLELDGAISLSEGQEAPFPGILLPITLAIELGFNIETLETRLIIDIEREQHLCRARLDLADRYREFEEERRDIHIQLLTERIQEQSEQLARPTPWYQRWGFAYGMGILTSVILVAGGVTALIAVM